MHNNFIQLAVDTGILGLFTWIGMWFYFFVMLYKRFAELDGDLNEKGVILGSGAVAIGFLAGGFFETNMYDSEVAMTLYFIMALPFSGDKNNTKIATKIK
jgi:O-antigen ligase